MIAVSTILQRIALNSLWLFLGRVSSQSLNFIFGIILARSLGADGLGRYAFVTGIVFLANAFTTFGTDMLIIREASRTRVSSQPLPLAAAIALQLGLSILLIGIIASISAWLPFPSFTTIALRLHSLSLIPLAISTVYSALLRGQERMDLDTLSTLESNRGCVGNPIE